MYKGEPQIFRGIAPPPPRLAKRKSKIGEKGGNEERKKEKRGENNQTFNSLIKYKHFFNLGVGQFFFWK